MKNNDKNIIDEKYFPVITEAVSRAKEYTNEKFNTIHWLTVGVSVVCFIGFLQLIMDSFHINSATYKEYSEKTQTVDDTLKINQELLNQNTKNQQIIIELQNRILNKK